MLFRIQYYNLYRLQMKVEPIRKLNMLNLKNIATDSQIKY